MVAAIIRTRPMTMFSTCLTKYVRGSEPLVADQTSSVPIRLRARTVASSVQSR